MSLTITNVHNQSKWVVLPILKFEVSYLDEGRASDCVTWLVMMSWLFWLGLKLKFSNFKIIQNFESWMHEDNDDDDEEYICRICPLLLAPSRKTTQAPWRCSPTLPQPPSPNHTMTTAGIGILTEFATDILLYWVPILFSFIRSFFLFF